MCIKQAINNIINGFYYVYYNKDMTNSSLEQFIQITVILTFIFSIVCFFIKLGEYKTLINTDIDTLKKDVEELKIAKNEMSDKVKEIETKTTLATSRLETLLIEVKVKLEMLMQFQGMPNSNNNDKFKN